jgi:hypothetical protein
MTMLLTREEMTLDFGGAKLSPERDRELLQWIFNQFLYGEVTGIQVGHWIYDAPDLESARFLAKQAIEEMQHVGNFVRIFKLLGLQPGEAHPVLRFLATGMMADSWAEHVALEMATGEGFVLMGMYGVIDTLDQPESVAILQRAVRQEESHVEFGETQTMKLIAQRPALARRLLGLNLVWRFGVQRLASFMNTRWPAHPVLDQMPRFLTLALDCNELRLRRMGVLDRPLAELSLGKRAALVAEAQAAKLVPTWKRKRRLTDTYLNDPTVLAASAALDAES